MAGNYAVLVLCVPCTLPSTASLSTLCKTPFAQEVPELDSSSPSTGPTDEGLVPGQFQETIDHYKGPVHRVERLLRSIHRTGRSRDLLMAMAGGVPNRSPSRSDVRVHTSPIDGVLDGEEGGSGESGKVELPCRGCLSTIPREYH